MTKDEVIAGALFDFMGWLTSRKERIVLSASDDAAPAVDAIRDFAKLRGLSLDDAQVRTWREALTQLMQEPINEAATRKRGVTTHCQCAACKNGNIHDSDCSVHNGDALPVGLCDCRLAPLAQPVQQMVSYDRFMGVEKELVDMTAEFMRVANKLAQPEERNFCSRCGKRTADLTSIHTCTPPQENT